MKYTHSFFSKLLFFLGLVFSGSYFLFSALLSPTITFQILANNAGQHQFLSEIFAPSAQATHSYIRTELSWDGTGNANNFSCSTGVPVQFQNDTGNRDRAIWKECFSTLAGAAGKIPATPLEGNFWSSPNTYGGYGADAFRCQSGSTLRGYNIRISSDSDDNTEWYACSSNTPVPAALVNNASCSSITVPTSVTPGQTFTATVVMNNTGTKTWNITDGHKLGVWSVDNNEEPFKWGLNRVNLPSGSVAPGNGFTFTFNATAPTTAGTYAFNGKMVQEFVGWFGGNCNKSISVTPPPPTSVSGSCNSGGVSVSWSSVSGAASYSVKADKFRNNNVTCPSSSGNEDLCGTVTTTSAYYMPSGSVYADYDAWVHSCANADGTNCSVGATHVSGNLFSCSASVAYSCSAPPANASLYGGANQTGLASNMTSVYSGSDTSAKCEYTCSSGYVLSGSSCVLAGGGGPPAPTVSLTANPRDLSVGGTTTLTWTSNNTVGTCYASGGGWPNGSRGLNNSSGENIVLNSAGTYTFTLMCWNSAGDPVSDTETVTVASGGGPSADIKANGSDGPVFISSGQSANITWSSSGVSSCSTWINPTTYTALSNNVGVSTGPLFADRNFDISCWPTANDMVEVKIGTPPVAPTLTFTADTPVVQGSAWGTILRWTVGGNATNCVASNGWSGPKAFANGNYFEPIGLTATTTYTLTCSNANGSITRNAVVTISAGGGPSSATTTVTVGCLPSGNCAADPRTTQLCSGQTFTIPDGCGSNMNCPGTRSCDYNWKEVAP